MYVRHYFLRQPTAEEKSKIPRGIFEQKMDLLLENMDGEILFVEENWPFCFGRQEDSLLVSTFEQDEFKGIFSDDYHEILSYINTRGYFWGYFQ